MMGTVLGVAAALLLSLGGIGTAPTPDSPSSSGLPLTMTAINWGEPTSLLDAKHPVWGHPAGYGSDTAVTVTIDASSLSLHSWRMHLEAPTSFEGVGPADCAGEEEAPPRHVQCIFEVPVSSGTNPLEFSFTADDRVVARAHGELLGGVLGWDAGYQVMDATGAWSGIAHDQAVQLPATTPTAMRTVLVNTGTIPLRATDSCSDRILPPHGELICPLRGVRPAQSLAGEYAQHLRLEDAVAGIASFDIRAGLRTFSGTFALGAPSVTVGQVIIVDANGLPTDGDFAMQFRIDEEPVLVGTSITRTGHTRLSFPLPSTSIGTAHVNVVHDGLTIASLPFDVTLVPTKPDAPPSPWWWLLLPVGLALAGGVAVLVRRRRRAARQRRLSVPGSPEPRQTDPYPDATPATQEPAAAHRP